MLQLSKGADVQYFAFCMCDTQILHTLLVILQFIKAL